MLTTIQDQPATVHVRLATPADDAALRAILCSQDMGDSMSVRLEREPSIFDALKLDGSEHAVVVATDTGTGEFMGMGVRTVRTVFVNGKPQPRGYLHLMRVRKNPRVLREILTQGYDMLCGTANGFKIGVDYTTIMADNTSATRLLTRGRAELPSYHPQDELTTYVLRARRGSLPRGVRMATPDDHPAIITLVNTWNRGFQFMPQIGADDLVMHNCDWIVHERNSRIDAVCAVWDQRREKQIIVEGSASPGELTRKCMNALARLRGLPALPPAETVAPIGMISHIGIEPDRLDVFDELLTGACAVAAKRGMAIAALIFSTRNPLDQIIRNRPAIHLRSRMYAVTTGGANPVLDGRPTQLETSIA